MVSDPSKAAIRLESVYRRFGSMVAVDGLDLELPAGEFFTILGPSGCGKTTTLRMVGGFERPSAGTIFLEGADVTSLPPYKRDVNTVFQSYALFPHLSVFENVAFGLKRKRVHGKEIRKRVERNLELVGLSGYGKRRSTQLSGGQQQRVALARALVNQPKVLLLDEPMGALDARIRKTMQVELKRIQREVGITFMYVTHDQSEAMAMSDRVAVMHAGRCEDVGPPRRVYDRPRTRFVAEFLGACNVLPVSRSKGAPALPDGTLVETEKLPSAGGGSSGDAEVGIRPEKLVVMQADQGSLLDSAPNRVLGTVATATYLGSSTEYEVETSWGGRLSVFAQNLDEAVRVAPGDRVTITWEPSHAFLLSDPSQTEPSINGASLSGEAPQVVTAK